MLKPMKLPTTLAALVVLPILGWTAGDLGLASNSNGDQMAIFLVTNKTLVSKKPLLLYVFSTNQYKPYVKELRTLNGENVLLDSPPDHLHHHGLMYAIRVNGINFWEETPASGIQKADPAIFLENAGFGLEQGFVQTVYWLAPEDRKHTDPKSVALLIERRKLVLSVNADRQEVALQWQSDFTTGTGTNKYMLSGAGYNGLGLRPIRSFDRVAKRLNPGGLPYSAEAKWDVLGGRWGALIGTVGNSEATLTIYNSPENKGEALYFSMLNPFAYLAATQGLDKKPLEYPAGAKFSVRYLVTLHQGARTVEWLDQRKFP